MANATKEIIKNTPLLRYDGGKGKLRQWIINYVPSRGSVYVEPFAGRGNLFWLAASCCKYQQWWLNDIRTYRFYEAIQKVDLSELPPTLDQIDEQRYLDGTRQGSTDWLAICLEPYLTHFGEALEERKGPNPVYRSNFCPGKRTPVFYRGRGLENSWSYYRMERCYKHLNICKQILAGLKPVISREHIFCTIPDALPWEEWKQDEEAFLYFDPPYLKANVTSYSDSDFDPERMIDTLLECKCRWLLSEYLHPLYLKWLGDPISTKAVKTGMSPVTANNKTKNERVECLWSNYML